MDTRFITRRALLLASLALALVFALPSFALAIPRSVALERGRVWVDKNVPYSQSRYATVAGDLLPSNTVNPSTKGYRTDCSGFVSMCLALTRTDGTPLSLDTASLPARMDKITKSELQPGDVVLRPKKPSAGISGHVVLFVGWTDESQTKFVCYEEGSSASGTIERVRTYTDVIAAGFAPYRYEDIEEDFADVQARISGADRYACAVSAATTAYPATADTVVLASGENWPDALGGSALAGAVDGPLLLTQAATLPNVTKNEIVRLKPRRVYILGGPSSVSQAVESRVASLAPEVVRLGGRDRYECAANVAREAVEIARGGGRQVDTAFVATGDRFPDALAAAPIAAATMRPILLTKPGELPTATSKALASLNVARIEVLGGEASVSKAVASKLSARYKVSRIADADRYSTSVLVARRGVELGLDWEGAGLSSGEVFADALAGGPVQGKAGSVMLLTQGASLPGRVRSEIASRAADIGIVTVYGGINTVTQDVRAEVASLLRAVP